MHPMTELKNEGEIIVNIRSKGEFEVAVGMFRELLELMWNTHDEFCFDEDFHKVEKGEFCIRIYLSHGTYYVKHAFRSFYYGRKIYQIEDFDFSNTKGI